MTHFRPFFRMFGALWLAPAVLLAADSAAPTAAYELKILSVQGEVFVLRNGEKTETLVKRDEVVRAGDRVRTAEFSRLELQRPDGTPLVFDELTDQVIHPPGEKSADYEIEVKQGGMFLRDLGKPKEQKFRTPLASGAILGTEFSMRVGADGRTELALFEGKVGLTNTFGGLELAPGEEAIIEPGKAPSKRRLLNASAAVQWVLFYPGVLPPDALGLAGEPALASSLAAYRAGDLPAALAAYPKARTAVAPAELTYLAQLALAAGQANRAEAALKGIDSPAAEALRSIIATVRGDTGVPDLTGKDPAQLLAASYAAQARNDLPTALVRAREAVEVAPQFAFAQARVAELEFSFGRVAAAEAALDRSLELAPRNAQALTLKGFVLAASNHTVEAQGWFEQALAIDPHLGNAWLGRGLCRIRSGDLEAGRKDLQAAAAHEPTRAFLRSYVAKAFTDERNGEFAGKELDRAKELDGNDPTAWLYSALLRQQENRVNEAVSDLEKSRTLNENRAVYRSRQLLDQDRAVRGANLASVYRDAGMLAPAVRAASRAVADDYANASAHQFLSSSYDSVRDSRQFNLRYETPWFSELLVANLLAPVGAGSLSQNLSQQEYSRMFERDRLGVSSVTEYFSNGTWTQRGSQFGTLGNFGYALDADYRTDPGFGTNTDTERLSLYAKAKWQLGVSDSVFAQLNYNRYEGGDTRQLYDPATAAAGFRSKEEQAPNLFAGWHHQWTPGQDTLLLASRLDDRFEYRDPNAIIPVLRRANTNSAPNLFLNRPFATTYDSELAAYGAELQHIAQFEMGDLGRHTVIAGIRFQQGEADAVANQTYASFQLPGAFVLPPVRQAVSGDLDRISAYAYDLWQILDSVRLTTGVSYERLDYPVNLDLPPVLPGQEKAEKVSPKVGLEWSPLPETHLRAAWTRSLGGSYYDTSVRLEPVQVAGFTQAFRSLVPESVAGLAPGSEFETLSVGLDHTFATRTYAVLSAERLTSAADQGYGAFLWTLSGGGLVAPATAQARHLDYEERAVNASLNQLLGDHWSVGVNYRLTDSQLDELYPANLVGIASSPQRSQSATLHQVSSFIRYNHECGFFGELTSSWNRQTSQGSTPALADEDVCFFDVFVGYRFLQRRGEVRVGILNLGDQDYRLNPLNLHEEWFRERTLFSSLRLNF
jgi:predicted Zn-dependent protease